MQTIVLGRRTADQASDDLAGVYAAHHATLLRVAYLLCGDAGRAEDAVADAFVKVFRQMQRGRVRDPGPYLRRAVVNEINSRFRRLSLERREAEHRWGDDRGARSAEDQVADSDLVYASLAKLPARQRTALVLRYYADLPEAEIATAMDISIGTVKSTLSRGLDKLRTNLGEEGR